MVSVVVRWKMSTRFVCIFLRQENISQSYCSHTSVFCLAIVFYTEVRITFIAFAVIANMSSLNSDAILSLASATWYFHSKIIPHTLTWFSYVIVQNFQFYMGHYNGQILHSFCHIYYDISYVMIYDMEWFVPFQSNIATSNDPLFRPYTWSNIW